MIGWNNRIGFKLPHRKIYSRDFDHPKQIDAALKWHLVRPWWFLWFPLWRKADRFIGYDLTQIEDYAWKYELPRTRARNYLKEKFCDSVAPKDIKGPQPYHGPNYIA